MRGFIFTCGAWFACVMATTGVVGPQPAHAQAAPRSSAHVYLMSGLAGFTSRLDGAMNKIKARGVPLTNAHPSSWGSLARAAIDGHKSGRVRSVIIVGYSAGGGAALHMADALHKANVPVQLVVTVEPVSTMPVRPNVRRLVNFYLPGGVSGAIPRPTGFRGEIKNILVKNPNLGHWTLAAAHEDEVVGYVLAASRGGGAPRAASDGARAPKGQASGKRKPKEAVAQQ
jgi:hypothetical protein